MNQGRTDQAEKLAVIVTEARGSMLGKDHPQTLLSNATLASIYRLQGRLSEAEKLGKDVLEATKQVLGEEHAQTLSSMSDLASTYRVQGRLEESMNMQEKALNISRRLVGEHTHRHSLIRPISRPHFGSWVNSASPRS